MDKYYPKWREARKETRQLVLPLLQERLRVGELCSGMGKGEVIKGGKV